MHRERHVVDYVWDPLFFYFFRGSRSFRSLTIFELLGPK